MGLRFLSQALFYDKIKLNHLNIKQIRTTRLLQVSGSDYIDLVPLTGLEPVRSFERGILRQITLFLFKFYRLTTKYKMKDFAMKIA